MNELSLLGFSNLEELRHVLRDIMSARQNSQNLNRLLYCSRRTAEINAIYGERLLSSIAKLPRDERSALFAWLGKMGPFLDDERTEVDEDLYFLNGEEVTELGPGEAARQCQKGNDGRLFSVRRSIFGITPLDVIHGLLDSPIETVHLLNSWTFEEAKRWADDVDPDPQSWIQLLDVSRRRYGRLLLGAHCDEVLGAETFYPAASRRILELLRVLDEIAGSADATAHLNQSGEELVQRHFVGNKAWFTDESDENKRLFGNDMTFPDPMDESRTVQCFWHGKIKTPQFRIHFEWPLQAGSEKLKILYIGPKISKK